MRLLSSTADSTYLSWISSHVCLEPLVSRESFLKPTLDQIPVHFIYSNLQFVTWIAGCDHRCLYGSCPICRGTTSQLRDRLHRTPDSRSPRLRLSIIGFHDECFLVRYIKCTSRARFVGRPCEWEAKCNAKNERRQPLEEEYMEFGNIPSRALRSNSLNTSDCSLARQGIL